MIAPRIVIPLSVPSIGLGLQAGGADNLVLLLRDAARKPSTEQAKAYALWALSLCIDESNHAAVAQAGGIPPLVKTLRRGSEVLKKEQAACALAKLAQHSDDSRGAIARAGGIEPLITLLDGQHAEASEASQQHAAAALSELALLPANRRAIDRAGGISPLVSLLWEQPPGQPDSVMSKKHAAAALARLSTEPGGASAADAAAAAAKAAREAAEAADDDDDATKARQRTAEHEAKTSMTLGEQVSSPQSRRDLPRDLATSSLRPHCDLPPISPRHEQIAEAGAISPLVKLLAGVSSTGTGNAEALDAAQNQEAQAEAAGALWALADHATNRISITENGGIGPLVALLGCEGDRRRRRLEIA